MPLTFLYFIFSNLPISVWSNIRFYLKSLSEKQAAVVHDPHIENWQPRITLHVGNQQHYIAVDQVWITNTFGVWRICLKSWSINFFWSGLTLTKYGVDIVYLVYTQFGKLICTTRYNHITTPSSLPQLLSGGISTRQNCYLLIAWKTGKIVWSMKTGLSSNQSRAIIETHSKAYWFFLYLTQWDRQGKTGLRPALTGCVKVVHWLLLHTNCTQLTAHNSDACFWWKWV